MRKTGLFLVATLIGCLFGLMLRTSSHADDPAPKQAARPLDKVHLYLCAFHTAKKDARIQFEAHHYCMPVGTIHQCMVFDSKDPGAKLLGVEYIIGDDVYRKLPDAEKKYWHPHAYEILSGQLIAPDMPKQGDDIFPGLIRTWGKTWHTWPDPTTDVPLGEPMLMWSSGGDGQINQQLIDKRDKSFGISTAEIRKRRESMNMAVPQIPPSKSMDEAGHQFNDSGPDEPQK